MVPRAPVNEEVTPAQVTELDVLLGLHDRSDGDIGGTWTYWR